MTISRDDAAAWFAAFHDSELAPRLLAIRPKIKSFEAALVLAHSQRAVIAALPHCDNVSELAGLALAPFRSFWYTRASGFNRPYAQATLERDAIQSALDVANAALRAFDQYRATPGAPMPDHVKSLPEYQRARAEQAKAFASLRAFNARYVSTYRKELRAGRRS